MVLRIKLLAILCLLPALALGHGALHEKIDNLRAAVAKKPDDAVLRRKLAAVYCAHGDWQQALGELERAELLAPDCPEVDLLRGQALLSGDRPAEAKKSIDEFLAVQPPNAQALRLRARAFAELKDPERSRADYRASLKLGVTDPDLVLESADALNANGHAEEAVQLLAAALAQVGEIPVLVRRAMELEISTGQFDSALKRVDRLQKFAPRPEPWMAKRASLLAQAGRVSESRAAWESLLAHLSELPNLERGSKPMNLLAEQARRALAALKTER